MFFSKVVLLAISLGAVSSVLATPHALHHHALHRRAVAARVASTHSNSSDATAKRQSSPKCNHHSPPSSSLPAITAPAVTAVVEHPKPPPDTTPTPSPTSTQPPPPPPSTTSAATPPPSTGGGNGPFTGDGTFFATGLGACGITNYPTDSIVAISQIRFDAASTGPNPNDNPLCGAKVSISFEGNSHTATIVDRCTGCEKDSLDMTTNLFQVFADLGVGRIHGIEWNFI